MSDDDNFLACWFVGTSLLLYLKLPLFALKEAKIVYECFNKKKEFKLIPPSPNFILTLFLIGKGELET